MSDLVGNPEDRFSRVEAHVILMILDGLPIRKLARITEQKFFVVGFYERQLHVLQCLSPYTPL